MRAVVARHPGWWLLILSLFPHAIASVINIFYNYFQIISKLDDAQKRVFARIICIYDPIGYAVGIALAFRILWPVLRAWRIVNSRLPGCPQQVDEARRIGMSWPFWAGLIACICWVPGGIVFPAVLSLYPPSLGVSQWVHLFVSFTLSGLVAATYSMYLVQWMSLCVVYPRLWCDRQKFSTKAAAELRRVPAYLWLLQIMAGSIPAIAAALFVHNFASNPNRAFEMLAIALIIFGSAAYPLAAAMSERLSKALAALTASGEQVSRSE
jgi:hypothetical protein